MADPVVAPAPSIAPLVAPGSQTTEHALARIVVLLSGAIAALGTIGSVLGAISPTFAAVPQVGKWLAIGGVAVAAASQAAYGFQRTLVKVAAINAGQAALVLILAFGLGGCATMSHAVVDTGDVDLGKGVTSRTTSAPTDPVSCTQLWTQAVSFPLPHDSAGNCMLDDINVGIPFEPGKGAQCKVTASPGAKACTKLVSTSCTVPIPRDAAGACP